MNNDPRDRLPSWDHIKEVLHQIGEETPEISPDFHARWMSAVEAEIMSRENDPIPTENDPIQTQEIRQTETRQTETRQTRTGQWKKWVAAAAAAVFLIGGTAATRDFLTPRRESTSPTSYSTTSSYTSSYKSESAGMGSGGIVYAADEGYSMAAESASMVYEEAAEAEYSATSSTSNGSEAQIAKDPRTKIIRTVSLQLTTRQYDLCTEAFRSSCENLGGWIESANESTTTSGLRSVEYTFRVPAEYMDTFLDSMPGDSFRVTRRTENSVDVSESYYDTKTRLSSQQELLARLQSMVTETATLNELLQLEREIADTQYRIDSYQSSLNSTDAKVNYGTIRITLKEEAEGAKVVYKELSFFERLGASLQNGFKSFGEFMEDMALFIAELLPVILVAVALLVVALLIRRSIKKKHATK